MNLELIFCFVRLNDFDEILKLLEGIFKGYDYFLLISYYMWMKMDKVVVMLVYLGDKFVGLVVSFVVDDERIFIC